MDVQAAGDVDWAAFDALAKQTSDEAAVAVHLDDRKRPLHAGTGHADCDAYADHLSVVVRKADRFLFRAFNYTTCCGPPDVSGRKHDMLLASENAPFPRRTR